MSPQPHKRLELDTITVWATGMVKQGPCLQEAHSPVPWAWDCWENRLDTVGGILLEKVMLRCPWEERQVVDPNREEPGVWGLKLQQEKRDRNIRDGQGPGTEDRKGTSCNVTQLIGGKAICQVRDSQI